MDTKKINIRNSDKDSILFIRKAERDDSGSYEMTVKIDSFEDKATLIIQIVGETCYDLELFLDLGYFCLPCIFILSSFLDTSVYRVRPHSVK